MSDLEARRSDQQNPSSDTSYDWTILSRYDASQSGGDAIEDDAMMSAVAYHLRETSGVDAEYVVRISRVGGGSRGGVTGGDWTTWSADPEILGANSGESAAIQTPVQAVAIGVRQASSGNTPTVKIYMREDV